MKLIPSKRFTLRLAAASVIAVVPASASLADPPSMLSTVPEHQHFIDTPNGNRVAIGPDVCANPELQDAFNQFHYNIHASGIRVDGVFVPDETLGPQHGAPGLDDDLGGELGIIGGC